MKTARPRRPRTSRLRTAETAWVPEDGRRFTEVKESQIMERETSDEYPLMIMCQLVCKPMFAFSERNLNPKAACLKRREEEKVEEESPEKRAVPGVDKPFDNNAVRGRGGRRGRRSSRGE